VTQYVLKWDLVVWINADLQCIRW